MELVPLKVKIGLKPVNGRLEHDYPNFNKISPNARNNMDWALFVDMFGGWHYDKLAGHSDHDPDNDSPHGVWVGMLLVPEVFAKNAAALYPKLCEIITEEKAEEFYNNRCAVLQPEIHEDLPVLQALAARKTLGELTDTSNEFVRALDVNNPAPGRRINSLKTWDGLKGKRNFSITKALAKNEPAKSVSNGS